MSALDRMLGAIGLERRSIADPYWPRFSAIQTAGAASPGCAESLSAVYACVSAISETIATLPLVLYRRTGDEGREKARDHPLYRVLHDSPNAMQSALEFREMMQASVLLRGNAYAEVIVGSDGQVRELIPMPADRVEVLRLDSGRLGYEYWPDRGARRRLLQDEVLHLRHRSDCGAVGISPITAARDVVELALAEREHGAATFRNGTRLSGVLKTTGKVTPDQRREISDVWAEQYSGVQRAGRTALLDGGLEFSPMSMSLEDAEWIAARQFSVEEVCRLFRVPPTIVGDLRHGNYSNSVEMARQFVVLSLRRHLSMWEQAISRCLLTDAGRRVYFAEHNVEGLLRGDSLARAQFYERAIRDGWMDADEVRRIENLPARPAGAAKSPATEI